MNPDQRIQRIHVLINPTLKLTDELASRIVASAIAARGLPKETTGLELAIDRGKDGVTATVRRGSEVLFSGRGDTSEAAWTRLVDQLAWSCAENREPPAKFGDDDLLRAAPCAHLFEFAGNMWRVRRWTGGTQIRVEFCGNVDPPAEWLWVFDAECAPGGALTFTRTQPGIAEDAVWFNALAGLVQFVMCEAEFAKVCAQRKAARAE